MIRAEPAGAVRSRASGAIGLALAGVRFRVGPAEALSEVERGGLLAMGGLLAGNEAWDEGAFTLELVDEPPWSDAPARRYPDRVAAGVVVLGDRIRITHARFLAELEPARRRGRVYRRDRHAGGVELALRVALTARLPSTGGIALHAAGVDMGGAGLVFFGPSGAGKSTLAATSPWHVYSDELVSVSGRPFRVGATGFWGALGGGAAARPPVPVAALVELAKGPRLALEELSPRLALRRLLGVTTLPLEAGLWRQALVVLGRIAGELPVLRMSWSPERPPWPQLQERFAVRAAPGRPA